MDSVNKVLKILKDPLRRRIIRLLAEEGPLEYTELLKRLGLKSTGHLNYHLKILRDFIEKDELGRYTLNSDGLYLYEFLKRFGRIDVETEYSTQSFKGKMFFLGIIIIIGAGVLFIVSMPSYDILSRIALTLYVAGYLITGSSASLLKNSFMITNDCSRSSILYSLASYSLVLVVAVTYFIATDYTTTYYSSLIMATLILLPALVLYSMTVAKCQQNLGIILFKNWVIYSIGAMIITVPLIIATSFANNIGSWKYLLDNIILGTAYTILFLIGSLAYITTIYLLDKVLSKMK